MKRSLVNNDDKCIRRQSHLDSRLKVHLKNENVLKVISEVISLFRILINMNFLEAECQVGGTYIKQNLRNGHSS